jgi:hypothetical protein
MSIEYAVNDHNISLTVSASLYILHMALASLPTRRGANHIWKHPRIPEFDRSTECCFSPLDTESPPLFSPSGGYSTCGPQDRHGACSPLRTPTKLNSLTPQGWRWRRTRGSSLPAAHNKMPSMRASESVLDAGFILGDA